MKTYIAEYRSLYEEDKPRQRSIQAHSVVQAETLADLRTPPDYKLTTIYEPHEVRSIKRPAPQYSVGDSFKTFPHEDPKDYEVFQVTKVSKRIVYYQGVTATGERIDNERYGVGRKAFESRWFSRHEAAPVKISQQEFTKEVNKYNKKHRSHSIQSSGPYSFQNDTLSHHPLPPWHE